jgi:23S rRNA pseudouridine1911/1915/1917 synthase
MTKKIPHNFTVPEESAGERLDIFLVGALGISRSQVQKMIEEKMVLVNNKAPRKAGDTLTLDACITIAETAAPKITTTTPKKITKKTPEVLLEIIAETPEYIVINKPTGLLTHATLAKEKNSVASILSKKYPEIKKIGDDPKRPGIVHRLDKDASGLLVVARTQKMFEHLKAQFKKRTIEKEYLVLVHGKVHLNTHQVRLL